MSKQLLNKTAQNMNKNLESSDYHLCMYNQFQTYIDLNNHLHLLYYHHHIIHKSFYHPHKYHHKNLLESRKIKLDHIKYILFGLYNSYIHPLDIANKLACHLQSNPGHINIQFHLNEIQK